MASSSTRRKLLAFAVGAAALAAGLSAARSRRPRNATAPRSLPRASLADSLSATARVLLPTVAKGTIIRRPFAVGLAERFELDAKAVREMQRLSDRYAPGPLLMRNPLRPHRHIALLLTPEHVHRVLEESPVPFATAALEKKGALSHFQPRFSLISEGTEREVRVRFNDEVLDAGRAAHRLAESFLRVLDEEAAALLGGAAQRGELGWTEFTDGWFRMVRRIVFGESAAADRELIEMIERLRARGNWSFVAPQNRKLRSRFLARVTRYLELAEPGSVAELIARTAYGPDVFPEQQVPQWLFAFDPAAMATFRALALLATHADQAERARREVRGDGEAARGRLPFLRACVLESLRLWPTTPLVLRESTRPTAWEAGTMPRHALVAAFANYFHRDDRHLPYAHRFTPEIWLGGGPVEEMMDLAGRDWPLIPFSGGPGVCSGRQVVLLLSSNMLGALLAGAELDLRPPGRLDPGRPLPGTLDHFTLRFGVTPVELGAQPGGSRAAVGGE